MHEHVCQRSYLCIRYVNFGIEMMCKWGPRCEIIMHLLPHRGAGMKDKKIHQPLSIFLQSYRSQNCKTLFKKFIEPKTNIPKTFSCIL